MTNRIKIFYDGECPFCTNYTQLLELKKSVGEVQLIDLRIDSNEHYVEKFTNSGLDVDQGMVVEYLEKQYYGAKAINVLAELSSGATKTSAVYGALFSNRIVSAVLYPMMKLGRSVTLAILGRSHILESSKKSSSFELIAFVWFLFSILHAIVYATQFRAPILGSMYLMVGLSMAGLVFRRNQGILLMLMLTVSLLDAWWQMPTFSNHTILKNFFLLIVTASLIISNKDGMSKLDLMALIKPGGRALLLTMYFFGVFHKINTGFLDTEFSCAMSLWQQMPFSIGSVSIPFIEYASIYGTLVIETLLFVCLLLNRLRHYGIIIGITFHSILALSGYAFYAPFSTLTIILHLLFLSEAQTESIVRAKSYQSIRRGIANPLGFSIAILWYVIIHFLCSVESYSEAGLVWLIMPLFIVYLVHKYAGEAIVGNETEIFRLKSRSNVVNLISVLFVFNCITPYLGLKTAQSMNMFANFRVESGQSNHLLVPLNAQIFDYAKDVVEVVHGGSPGYVSYFSEQGYHLVYYDLLDKLERDRSLKVSYLRNGELFEGQSFDMLPQSEKNRLHSRLIRKWFNFMPVYPKTPEVCTLHS